MTFESHSQAGQDSFVRFLIGDRGTFLDIGACEPIRLSNTYALEQLGWTGWLIENDVNAIEPLRLKRRATVMELNAAEDNEWFWKQVQSNIDYLSLDIDAGTFAALQRIPERIRFKVITIEHDFYRFGESLRGPERKVLTERGYVLAKPDVKSEGMIFEDWWVSPELAAKANEYP